MRFEILGPMRVNLGDHDISLSGPLRRSLLALLLAHANEPVPVDSLLDALWCEPVDQGAARLQVHVHRLRRALDTPERLTYEPGGYRLRVDRAELDAERFNALVEEAATEPEPARAAALLRDALALWRGQPYQDVDVRGLGAEIQRLSELYLLAVERLYAAELCSGRHAEVSGELLELVRRHPLREQLHALLMEALYRSGRQADALSAYQHARDVLGAELGLEPGPELRALQARILAGERLEPASAARAPAQLPHAAAGLVGHESALSALDEMLARAGDSMPIAVITGTAGVGKTTLALRWAHQVKGRFPDGQLHVDLRGFGPGSPVDPADALAGWLRALGVDGKEIPHDPAERSARLRSLLDGKRVLLLLDNAVGAEQVRPLLPGSSGCAVLVTSRYQLAGLVACEGACRVDLQRMSPDEAKLLMKELLGEEADDDAAVDELVECCARLPLALRIAAERVRGQGGVARAVAEFTEHAGLDLLDGGDAQACARTVFEASYRHLGAEHAHFFRLFGLHPGQEVDCYSLTAMAGGQEVRATRRGLIALVRAHLAEEVPGGRFRLHDLLASYAAELAAADPEHQRHAALHRLYEYYVQACSVANEVLAPGALPAPDGRYALPVLRDHEEVARWLDAERATIVRFGETARGEFAHYAAELSTALVNDLDFGWHVDQAERLHGRAREVAFASGDIGAEGTSLRGLAQVRFRRNEFDEAEVVLDLAVQRLEAAGRSACLAAALHDRAEMDLFTGRTESALENLRRSIELHDELGLRLLGLRPLLRLSRIHRRWGRHEEALECLHEATRVAEEHDYLPAAADAAYVFAGVYRDLGRHTEALEECRRALTLAHRAGLRFLEGVTLHRIGTIHRCLGDHARALEQHDEAVRFARRMGAANLEAIALVATAETRTAMGDHDAALRCHRSALDTAEGSHSHYARARAHSGLGDLHEQAGRHQRAEEHRCAALEIFRALDAPEARKLVRTCEPALIRAG